MNRLPLEHHQRSVVSLPSVGGQSRLEADLLQERFRIEAMIDRHARQQQSAVVAALDQQAVLADHHRADAIFAAGSHRLRPPENPHVDVEFVQLGTCDGRKARIVGRRAIGRMVQRIASDTAGPRCPQHERRRPSRRKVTNAP